jgi:hypothetical protein
MALRKIIETQGKVVIDTPSGNIDAGSQKLSFSAYIKVLNVSGDKSEIIANVVFKNDAYQFTKQYQIPVSVETGALNFIAQAYNYLKTLPEFSNAEDC